MVVIDPVNMQHVVTRAPEVARVQRVQEGALSAQGQVFAQELARQAQQVEEAVASSPQAQRSEWREKKKKERERGEKARASSRQRTEVQVSEHCKDSGELGHFIDTTA
ncbi:TetR family transcriptional regulator [Candidatus Caldatribacterium sp. SIUC1]|uniref:TetR family transcriptional regulator n=1 Tax=Candidatus Caldatribacterium sp. SIUC1 TaxID=3418365 RepID=UPI003F693301